MSAIYLETSAWLSWLLGEAAAAEVGKKIESAGEIFTSTLTLLETERALVVAEHSGRLKASERSKLLGLVSQRKREWLIMEMHSGILQRAADKFPVEPIRALDAIHLATALEFLQAQADLLVLSCDQRVLDNLEPLGLHSA